MAEVLRHVGKTINTDRRIVVVYMQIPGRTDHALVIDTDALPQQFHDELMDIVQGEGQKTPVLADILGRRIMAYSGADILSTLHQHGRLQPMPVSNIMMLPQPNHPVPLSKIIEYMNTTTQPPVEEQITEEPRDNRIIENQAVDKENQQYQIAANILAEAEMLADEAKRKREQAYKMYPGLRPKTIKVEVGPGLTKAQAAEVVHAVSGEAEKEIKKTTRKAPAKKATT